MMHVLEDYSDVSCDSYSFLIFYLYLVLLHVQQIKKTALLHQFKHNVNIWDFRNYSHEHSNVWVSQNTLHHDFILDFLE